MKLLELDMPVGERVNNYRDQIGVANHFRRMKVIPIPVTVQIIEQLLDDLEVYAKPLGLIKETKNAVD